MKQEQFDEMRDSISIDFLGNGRDRFANFKRAAWYGSSGHFGGYLGDGKGLRKTIRSIPEKLMKRGASGVVSVPLKVVTAPISVIPIAGSIVSGLIYTAVITPIELSLDKAISEANSLYTMKREDGSSFKGNLKNAANKVFKKSKSSEGEEQIRKKIKQDLKDLKGTNPLVVIDRNLVKMKDAQHKINPAVKKMEELLDYWQPSFDGLDDMKIDAVRDTMGALIETEYYVTKVTNLVDIMQEALIKLKEELKAFDKEIANIDDKVEKYIIEKM